MGDFKFVRLVGVVKYAKALTFSAFSDMPSFDRIYPQKDTAGVARMNFSAFSVI